MCVRARARALEREREVNLLCIYETLTLVFIEEENEFSFFSS